MKRLLKRRCILLLVCACFALLSQQNQASALEQMNFYFGNLHSHTRYSDGTGTPRDHFAWARDVAKFDFYAVTDHGELLDPYEWWLTGRYANTFNQDGVFVAIRGFEWSHPVCGHINVWNTSSYTNAVIDYTLPTFSAWLNKENGMAQFNHPGREIGVFENVTLDSAVVDNMIAIETGNKGSGNNDSVHAYYQWYVKALDNGWKAAPTFGQDNNDLVVSTGGRTVVAAPALTRSAILDALRARRVYSTDDPNMKVTFISEDQWMGSSLTVSPGSTIGFTVLIEDDEPIIKAELIGDGGAVLAEQTFAPDSLSVVWSPAVNLTNETYIFLRVTEEDRNGDMPGQIVNIAYTAPFWFMPN